MKRFFLLTVLVIFLLGALASADEAVSQNTVVGGSIFLGQYEQDNHADNGPEPIEWIILDIKDNSALLVSKYVLDCQQFNTEKTEISWETSSLRQWMNDTFVKTAFNESELSAILTKDIENGVTEQNPQWEAMKTGSTQDQVFLLSYEEAKTYFPEDSVRKTNGTEYARALGAKFLGMTTLGYTESDWWLRSPGAYKHDAAFTSVLGDINTKQVIDKVGIRPAVWLDLSVDRSFFPYEQFMKATQWEYAGQYEDAANTYESLGNYNNSEQSMKRVQYLHAQKAVEQGDYKTALRLYESLGNYEDSFLQGRACRYALAVELQDSGDYDAAAKMFEKAGQYEDSMKRLKECYDKLGVSIYYFSEEATSTGVDTGYSKSDTITGNDRHFGWRMGRFFVSGFTRVTPAADQPIFIKTLGDSVTLWFDLEQNIDALNNNNLLVVSADNNGFNQYFGVQRTNFGRGTLIVRHTNYQNSKDDPQIYTDYLLAKGTSGADTKVVLHEEGDYEVELNYEIQDNDITHITNKYGNYKIALKFSVRNGNCMVYPFDALTGAELQNTAVTENGFYLDLARSRYLDINVRRSVIVEGPSGMIEDERFNRPAKDGDQYTAEGIYTISVNNRYTGESTTKTIFVGSDELLQEYIQKGFSMDRLK